MQFQTANEGKEMHGNAQEVLQSVQFPKTRVRTECLDLTDASRLMLVAFQSIAIWDHSDNLCAPLGKPLGALQRQRHCIQRQRTQQIAPHASFHLGKRIRGAIDPLQSGPKLRSLRNSRGELRQLLSNVLIAD